ncbi:hypothetical protein FN846DRAFT_86164 [Sphaerosporella brunnea]|uniref:Uncharacterized protein n=1 Tax=Sphaerosporella brunnea TaxID=1250544 RepID=A0A5J5ET82_9PEZI|nr:hypothetical protein FN846DRAFT_86164 [Sphaerosporella brunnea]
MNAYFSAFKSFTYDSKVAPESEFQRLTNARHWKEGSKTYKRHRRAFLSALATQTLSAVHRFFVETYPFPSYDPTANPKLEFERLAKARRWNPRRKAYHKAKADFDRAFQKEFGAQVLDFFEEHEGGEGDGAFVYDARRSAVEQLYELADIRGWGWRSQEWRNAKLEFYDAIAADFNNTFGHDGESVSEENMAGWHFLCVVLGVDHGNATTPAECANLVKDKHVNIYDILDFVRDGMPQHRPLKFHETVKDLSDYSYGCVPPRIYPLDRARRGSLVFVLRGISKFHKLLKPGQGPVPAAGSAPA